MAKTTKNADPNNPDNQEEDLAALEAEQPAEEVIEPPPNSAVREIRSEVAAKAACEKKNEKPSKGKKKKGTSVPDEPELAPELLPYKEQMKEWVSNHEDFLHFFFNIRGTDFTIVYGDWFYYTPDKNQICLGVKAYKEAIEKNKDDLESGAMSLDQVYFALLHEIAHYKTTLEGDKAGKINLLEHFKYMARKKIESKDKPGKFISLGGAYGNFYNIMEDAIVNHMVGNTIQYSTPEAKQQILELYASKFFQLFVKAEEGKGNYTKIPDPGKDTHTMEKVEMGKGEYRLLNLDDYKEGFDVSEVDDMENLTSQFLTFFIKCQMGVMKAEDFYDGEEFKNGKYKVPVEIAGVFREPLHGLYERLLIAIIEKYGEDPEKMKRYKDFMGDTIAIPLFAKQAKGVTEVRKDIIPNVFSPSVLRAANIAGEAWSAFLFNMKKLGIPNAETMTLIQIFNKFKELDFRQKRMSIPFTFTYTQRTAVIRKAIEPIFSMFCILDDSFDLKLPPETQPHGPQGPEPPDPPDPPKPPKPPEGPEDLNAPWQTGVEVRDRRTGKRGVIKKVYKDEDDNDKVISVDIAYFDEVKTQMIANINGREVEFTGQEVNIEDPVNNLSIVKKKRKKQKGEGKPGQIKYEQIGDEPEEDDEEDDDDDQGEESDGDDDKNEDDNEEKDDKGTPGARDDDEGLDMDDIKDVFGGLIDALEQGIEDDDRKENEEEFAKAEESVEYQQRRSEHERNEALEEALRKLREENGEEPDEAPVSEDQARYGMLKSNAEVIKKYNELEDKIRPYVEKMADMWREVIENIAQVVSLEKDKYYTQGTLDIRRAQRYMEEAEFGADLDRKRIKELWIETIRTEIKPKMLRLHLFVDNSGSMSTQIDQIRMVVMMLNSSLASLRSQFKTEMEELLGAAYTPDMDLVCDIRITTFGNSSREVKPFAITDLQFLNADPNDISELPTIDVDAEQVATMRAFQKIDCSEGTEDRDFWPQFIVEYERNPELLEAIQEGKLTDVIIQISDGDIGGEESTKMAAAALKKLSKMGVKHGGFAIGDGRYEASPEDDVAEEQPARESHAEVALAKRHGKDKVKKADTVEEIVDNFSDFLAATVKEEVQQPMIKSIKGSKED